MKRNKILLFTKIIYGLFIISTIILLFIIYKKIDIDISFKFLIGYVLLVFFMLVYIPFITIMNARKLKWIHIKKSIFKFITIFILFSALNYVFNYIFRSSEIDLLRIFSTSLGISFSIAFVDITFLK